MSKVPKCSKIQILAKESGPRWGSLQSSPRPPSSGVASMEQMEQLIPPERQLGTTYVIRADPTIFLWEGEGWTAVWSVDSQKNN